jgi:hypothetical protein
MRSSHPRSPIDHQSNNSKSQIFDQLQSLFLFFGVTTKSSKGWLWHSRLAHVGMNQLKKLMKHDLVIGFNNDIFFEKNKLCSGCQASKQVGNTHPIKSVMSTSRQLELLHMDLFGSTTYKALMEIVMVLLLWMTIQDILEFSF